MFLRTCINGSREGVAPLSGVATAGDSHGLHITSCPPDHFDTTWYDHPVRVELRFCIPNNTIRFETRPSLRLPRNKTRHEGQHRVTWLRGPHKSVNASCVQSGRCISFASGVVGGRRYEQMLAFMVDYCVARNDCYVCGNTGNRLNAFGRGTNSQILNNATSVALGSTKRSRRACKMTLCSGQALTVGLFLTRFCSNFARLLRRKATS